MTGQRRIPFGGRILQNENEIFEQNAWDHCEMSADMLSDSLCKIKQQQEMKCENPDEFDDDPHKFWDKFYSEKGATFFKDRHWLQIEFPELFEEKQQSGTGSEGEMQCAMPFTLCEVGCGAGNTVFPFLETAKTLGRANVFAYAFDYSSSAVEVVKSSPLYDDTKMRALVYDLTSPTLPHDIPEGSIDICTCIFVFSAINPRDWRKAASNLYKLLKPGGILLLRDYGRYDLAQIRMKKGRLLQDNFYRRGDGTRVYFFTLEELNEIFQDFDILQNASDKRLIVNRKEQLKMFRCWQQGKFRKPFE